MDDTIGILIKAADRAEYSTLVISTCILHVLAFEMRILVDMNYNEISNGE